MGRKAQVDVSINGEQAKAELKKIADKIEELEAVKKKLLLDGKSVDGVNREIKKLNSEAARLSKNIIDVDNVLKNLSSASIQELNTALRVASRELNQMKRTDPGFGDQQMKVKALRNEIETASGRMKQHQSGLTKLADGFNKYFGMATTFLAGITGVVLGFRKASEEADNFEKRLDVLSSLTGLEGKELEYLSQEATRLSTATIEGGVRITQAADEILDAYTKVGSARPELLKDKEALNQVTQEAMTLAAAADTELQPAVESLTGVLNQFNYPASEARRVINTIAAGSKEGAGEIPFLKEAIEKSGTAAKDAGIEIEELVGIIETMAPRMTSPEKAGTSLRGVILKLQQTADDTNPSVVGFTKAIDNMAAKNLSAAQMVEIFGLENITAAKILMNNREEMKKYTAAVTGTNVALEQAAKNTDNDASKKAQARNELKNITRELGEKLSPAILVSTNGFTYLVKALVWGIEVFKNNAGVIVTSIAAYTAYTLSVKLAALWTERHTAGKILNTIAAKAEVYWLNISIVATQLYAAAQMLLAGNIKGAAQAMRILNTVIKTSPLGLAVSAIAALTVGLIMYKRKLDEVSYTQQVMNKVNEDASKEYNTQAARIDLLVDLLHNEKLALNIRKKALDEIKKIMPEYNGQLTAEGKLIKDNTSAIDDYLKKLEQQIKLKAIQDELTEQFKLKREADKEVSEALNKEKNLRGYKASPVTLPGQSSEYAQAAQSAAHETSVNNVNKALQKRADILSSIEELKKELTSGDASGLFGTSTEDDSTKNKVRTISALEEEIRQVQTAMNEAEIGSAEFASFQQKLIALNKEKDAATGKSSAITNKEMKNSLDIKKDLAQSEIELMEETKDKRLAILTAGYEAEKAEVKLKIKTGKADNTLTVEQEKDLNKLLANLDDIYKKEQEEINKEWHLKELNNEKEAIELQLASVQEGSAEELGLKKELLQKNLEIELASVEGSEEKKAELRKLLSAKNTHDLAQLELEYGKKFLEEQTSQDIIALTENHRKELEVLRKNYEDGKLSLKEYNKERKKEEERYSKESLEIALKKAEEELKIIKASGGDITQAEAAIADIRLKQQQNSDNATTSEDRGSDWEDWSDQERVNFAIDSAQQIADAEFKIAQEKNQRELDEKLDNLEKQRDAELSNKNLTEAQKEAINKKYDAKAKALQKDAWDKQHKADLASAWINMALSIGRAANNAWPVPAIPMMAAAALMGGLQIAQISKQKNPYKSGGFTDQSMSDDTPAGEVHANEFVANAYATRNPSVRKVLDVIDYAQRNGSIRTINLPALIASREYERKLKSGGFVTSSSAGVPSLDNGDMMGVVNEFRQAINDFKTNGIKVQVEADARLIYQDYKKMEKKEEDAIRLTS